jgi:hypothetical protein
VPNNHEDLVCWQLADELRRIIIAETADGTPAACDLRFTTNLRDAISPERTAEMTTLCDRAMRANLRFLNSLKRDDPDVGGT